MDIIIGRGNNRQAIKDVQTGYTMRRMEKNNPVEYVKIKGGIMALVRDKGKRA